MDEDENNAMDKTSGNIKSIFIETLLIAQTNTSISQFFGNQLGSPNTQPEAPRAPMVIKSL